MIEPVQSQTPTTTRPKPFVFVLMPFSREFDRVYEFIQNACRIAGAHAERIDKQMFQKSIMEQIYNQIAKADIIVADMTGRNPNVFYEVGYAHALGKRAILLTQKADDIPFDLTNYQHIIYGRGRASHEPLLVQLPKWIEWAIAHPDAPLWSRRQIQLEIQGSRLAGTPPVIEVTSTGRQGSELELILNLQNSLEYVIRDAEFKLMLMTSERFFLIRASQVNREGSPVGYSTSTVSREGHSQKIHFIREKFSLMPGEWESLKLELSHKCRKGAEEEVVFRVLTNFGEQSYSCFLKIRA